MIVSLSGSLVRLLGHRHSPPNCRSSGGQTSEMTFQMRTSGPNTLRKLVLDPFAAQQKPTVRITKEEPALHETVPTVVPIFSSRCGFCE